ncbi:MAG: hypothetical protein M0P55_15405 [Clostridiales bacterium]|jgi:hypothetical protein|nr:hypothetical protein [Clostridiales bacterium]
MTVVFIDPDRRKFYLGVALDTKPTENVPPGSEFFETDTKATYIYTGSAWVSKT